MRLSTANHNAKRALRRAVYRQGFAYHQRRTERLTASGTLHKLRNSGYVRRLRKSQTEFRPLL